MNTIPANNATAAAAAVLDVSPVLGASVALPTFLSLRALVESMPPSSSPTLDLRLASVESIPPFSS